MLLNSLLESILTFPSHPVNFDIPLFLVEIKVAAHIVENIIKEDSDIGNKITINTRDACKRFKETLPL